MLPSTRERVSKNTSSFANEAIRRETELNIARYGSAGNYAIDRRLRELDQEWDIERCLETMAPAFTLFGLALGSAVDRRWLILPAMVQTFLLQHALQGWCPPIPVLRKLGVRTIEEIDHERYALKALRGDFDSVTQEAKTSGRASEEAMSAVQRDAVAACYGAGRASEEAMAAVQR